MDDINIVIEELNPGDIALQIPTYQLGYQYDHEEKNLHFIRPEERINDQLWLVFENEIITRKNGGFTPICIGLDNDFPIINTLTQFTNLSLQIYFIDDNDRKAHSNAITFKLGKSLTPGRTPVVPYPFPLDVLWDNAFVSATYEDGILAFYNASGNKEVELEIGSGGGGTSTIAWYPMVNEDGVISWTRTSTTVPPEATNIKGTDGTDGRDGRDGLPGEQGTPGEPIELQVADGRIQWKLVSDTIWTNLVPLSDITGQNGIDGQAATIAVGTTSTGNPGTNASVTNSGTSSAAVFNFTVPKGEPGADGRDGRDGEDGTGVTILGSYDTVAALKAAHPTGSPGEAYLVAGDLYVWSDTLSDWDNVGRIQGPQGNDGTSPIATVTKDGVTTTITVTDTNGTTTAAVNDGQIGADGREIQLQLGSTHIQWRYAGDTAWINLISIAEITGPNQISADTDVDGIADGMSLSVANGKVSGFDVQTALNERAIVITEDVNLDDMLTPGRYLLKGKVSVPNIWGNEMYDYGPQPTGRLLSVDIYDSGWIEQYFEETPWICFRRFKNQLIDNDKWSVEGWGMLPANLEPVLYDEDGNLPVWDDLILHNGKIFGRLPDETQHVLVATATYNAGETNEFTQNEFGSEVVHMNLNSLDRPTTEMASGTEQLAFLSDIDTAIQSAIYASWEGEY